MIVSEVIGLAGMSENLTGVPNFVRTGEGVSIEYSFNAEDGSIITERLNFTKTAAWTFVDFDACTVNHLGAYEKLILIVDSEWASTMRELPSDIKHFMIFFDNVGAYEVLAVDFFPSANQNLTIDLN